MSVFSEKSWWLRKVPRRWKSINIYIHLYKGKRRIGEATVQL